MLIAVALELPEDYLTNIHQYEAKSEVRPEIPLNFQTSDLQFRCIY